MRRDARGMLRTGDEDGIALVVAVLVLGLVSIMSAAAIFYTTSGQKDAASRKSEQTAYALAQAALSNATAQLTAHYYDSTGQPHDNTTSLTAQAQQWAPSGDQQSPDDSTTCTATSACMHWQGVLDCPAGVSCPGGSTISVSGIERARWHITGTGTVPNPSGPGVRQKTITIDVPVDAPPAQAPAPDIFKIIYNGKVSSGCDLTTGQNVTWAAPVYVLGNLCINQGAGIEAGADNLGKLNVGGWLDVSGNGAHVGTSSTPISTINVAKSCDSSHSALPCVLAPPVPLLKSYYWDTAGKIFSAAQAGTPSFPDPPVIDWTQRQTDRGTWSCTGGHSLTAASFSLTGTPYTCTTESGSLVWDGSTLAVSGNVYIDGNLTTPSNAQFTYTGLGNIFVGGSASFGNNTSICVGSFNSHDCPNQDDWPNIDDNFLLILVKQGITGGQNNSNFSLEGGLYSDSVINFGSGQSNIYGPIVTPDQIFPGQQAIAGFPNIVNLFTGLPGSPQPFWTLGKPKNGTY